MAQAIVDVITNIHLNAESEGAKRGADLILKMTRDLETLGKERIRLGKEQEQIAKKDIAAQKAIAEQIRKNEAAIKSTAKAIINERIANSDLNKEIVKQVGFIGNLNQKLDALKNKHAMAQTATEARAVTAEMKKIQRELDSINGKASKGGGLLGQLLGGFGLGGGIGSVFLAFNGIKSLISDSISEIEDADRTARTLERTLRNIGRGEFFTDLLIEADELQQKFHGLFDNDDIIKAQTALVQYGKVTRNEISKLVPVILELATAEGIDLVQATEKVVNILEGRGGQTLRDYGLSVKGVKTEHDRLNLVLGEFAKKLAGTNDAYANTAAGIKQANEVILNDTKEKIGEKLLPIYIGFLQGVNELFEGNFQDLGLRMLKFAQNTGLAQLLGLPGFAKPRTQASISAGVGLVQSAIPQFLNAKKGSADEVLNPNAKFAEQQEKTEKAAKKSADKKRKTDAELAEEFKRRTEQEFNDNLKLREEYNQKELFLIEQLNSTGAITEEDYRDLQLERQLAFFTEQILFYQDYGKDVYDLRTKQLKALEELENRQRAKNKAKIEKEGSITGEFFPGTNNDVEVGLDASVFNKEGEAARINSGKKTVVKNNEEIIKSFEDVNTIIQTVGDSINQVTQARIDAIDREITAQQGRIERAKRYAERGGAELLEIEEERLDALEERREKFARRQLIINNALALSNAIVAVATTAAQSGVTSIATIPAVLAAIAAGYALATSLTEPQSFAEGTKSVQGPGTETSDSVPARLSKGERVITARRSREFKPLLDDIQDGKYKSLHDLYGKIHDGTYSYGMDYTAAINSRTGKEFSNADVVAAVREVRDEIRDKPVGQLNADERGLTMYMMRMQQRILKRNKY